MKRGKKNRRFGDCFERYRIKGRNIGNWGDCFFQKKKVFIGERKERRRRGWRPEDEAKREMKEKGN